MTNKHNIGYTQLALEAKRATRFEAVQWVVVGITLFLVIRITVRLWVGV